MVKQINLNLLKMRNKIKSNTKRFLYYSILIYFYFIVNIIIRINTKLHMIYTTESRKEKSTLTLNYISSNLYLYSITLSKEKIRTCYILKTKRNDSKLFFDHKRTNCPNKLNKVNNNIPSLSLIYRVSNNFA